MKCKLHPYDLGVGVCASCLRERLYALVAAQNELSPTHDHLFYDIHGHQLRRRRSGLLPLEASPPSLAFPRSVSPYVFPRRSVGSDASAAGLRRHEHFQRFFSTPQVGPTFESRSEIYGDVDDGRKRSSRKFSFLKTLLGHRRSQPDPYFDASKSSRSRSWFSALIHGRRKEKRHLSEAEELDVSSEKSRRPWRPPERGISPEIHDYDEKEEDSGYSSDSSTGRRRPMPTPMRSFPVNHRQRGSLGSVSGFAVCLSPLVRAGTRGRRSQAAEAGISVETRASGNGSRLRKAMPGAASSLAPNRSLKLADFGRFR